MQPTLCRSYDAIADAVIKARKFSHIIYSQISKWQKNEIMQ